MTDVECMTRDQRPRWWRGLELGVGVVVFCILTSIWYQVFVGLSETNVPEYDEQGNVVDPWAELERQGYWEENP